MPPKGFPWDANAERDLTLAAWGSCNGTEFKADWNKAHQLMVSWGYPFSKDAINQRWSKKILKDFRERHENDPGANMGATGAAAAGGAPSKSPGRKRARTVAKTMESSIDVDDDEEETKPKAKKARRATPKRQAAPTKKLADSDNEDGDDEADDDLLGGQDDEEAPVKGENTED